MNNKKFLLIVEGEKDEINIFSEVLKKYNFRSKKINIDFSNLKDFDVEQLVKEDIDVYIASSKQNRIHDIVIKFNEKEEDIERLFNFRSNDLQGIFLVFDVDHNDKEDLNLMFNKFNNENTGLLLVNSPSIEVIGDLNFNQLNREEHFYSVTKGYKRELNKYCQEIYRCNIWEFIINNFDKQILQFLQKNTKEFNEKNIMEHPRLVVNKINKMNDRINYKNEKGKIITECFYRYFTTVIYVFIAYINGLTIQIDNYDIVYNFFKEQSNQN